MQQGAKVNSLGLSTYSVTRFGPLRPLHDRANWSPTFENWTTFPNPVEYGDRRAEPDSQLDLAGISGKRFESNLKDISPRICNML